MTTIPDIARLAERLSPAMRTFLVTVPTNGAEAASWWNDRKNYTRFRRTWLALCSRGLATGFGTPSAKGIIVRAYLERKG